MTDAPTGSFPAAWYPDPAFPGQERWWTGTAWSAYLRVPPADSEPLRAPENTNPQTPWIWLNVFVPLAALVFGILADIRVPVSGVPYDPTDPSSGLVGQGRLLTSPQFLLSFGVGLLFVAASIVFAYLDWRVLQRRGVPAPFNWRYAFLGILAPLMSIYPIARSVVATRRTGLNTGVLPVAIAVAVVTLGFRLWSYIAGMLQMGALT